MKKFGYFAIAAVVLCVVPDARANEVIDKCNAVMSDLNASNVEEGCVCFAAEISESGADEYLKLDTAEWETKASQDLKAASDVCFPGFQDS